MLPDFSPQLPTQVAGL